MRARESLDLYHFHLCSNLSWDLSPPSLLHRGFSIEPSPPSHLLSNLFGAPYPNFIMATVNDHETIPLLKVLLGVS
jgi:hypothetical protein